MALNMAPLVVCDVGAGGAHELLTPEQPGRPRTKNAMVGLPATRPPASSHSGSSVAPAANCPDWTAGRLITARGTRRSPRAADVDCCSADEQCPSEICCQNRTIWVHKSAHSGPICQPIRIDMRLRSSWDWSGKSLAVAASVELWSAIFILRVPRG